MDEVALAPRKDRLTERRAPPEAFQPIARHVPEPSRIPCRDCPEYATKGKLVVYVIGGGPRAWAEVAFYCDAHAPLHHFVTAKRLFPWWDVVPTAHPSIFRIRLRPKAQAEAALGAA